MLEKMKRIDKEKIEIRAVIIAVILTIVVIFYSVSGFIYNNFYVFDSLKYNMFTMMPFVCFAVSSCYFVYHLVSEKNYKYENVYLICALMFGIAMQVIMPPISGPDENTHFLSAYHGSDVILLMDDYGQEGPFYQRVEEQRYPAYYESFPEIYRLIADGHMIGLTSEEKELFLVDEVTVSSNRYPFSALGIAIARLLGLGVVPLLYSGRLMNMLVMVICGYFAVKLSPYGKAQIVGFSMIPLILELCNSYSYDGMSIMMTILFTVLCLRYSEDDIPLTWLGIYGLATVYALLVPQKTVYLFFFPMAFMIPWKKFKNLLFVKKTKKAIAKTVVFLLYFVTIMFLDFRKYLAIAFGILGKSAEEGIEQMAERPSFTVGYMVHNPGKVFAIMWSTFKNYAWIDIRNMFGETLGSHKLNVPVPTYLIVMLIICVLAALFVNRGKWIGKKRFLISLVGVIIVFAAIILGCLLRFTPIEGTDRIQIAGRYYLPVFLSSFILLGTDREENKTTLVMLALQNSVLILIMCNVFVWLLNLGS